MTSRFGALERALGHGFAAPALLRQALTHRSYGTPNNERLEYLGDSILNCVMAIALFERFERLREGELSRLRADLVRQEALHRVASDLGLGDHLLLGEGELKSGGKSRPSILADALEAVFAAVHLDAGFEAARRVILALYDPLLDELQTGKVGKDPKTALQEWLQGRHKILPRYNVIEVSGEDHAQVFKVECEVGVRSLRTVGEGSSRRAAEQAAAEQALAQLETPRQAARQTVR